MDFMARFTKPWVHRVSRAAAIRRGYCVRLTMNLRFTANYELHRLICRELKFKSARRRTRERSVGLGNLFRVRVTERPSVGKVDLRDLILKKSALDKLDLPFGIVEGKFGYLFSIRCRELIRCSQGG